MSYTTIEDLPQSIRDELPEPAQELYRAAYNRALEKGHVSPGYVDEADASLAETAHKQAWRKVQQEYQQDASGQWHKDSLGEDMQPDEDMRD